MAELLSAITDAFRAGAPPGVDPLMGNAMRMLAGDWTPLDTIRPQLKEWIVVKCNGQATEEAIAAVASELTSKATTALANSAAVNQALASFVRDDLPDDTPDAIATSARIIGKHLVTVLRIWAHHDADASGVALSTAVKDVEVVMIGEWFEALLELLQGGYTGLRGLQQMLSQHGAREIMTHYPQHAQVAMFGLPMLLNMMNQFHAAHRQALGLPPLAPQHSHRA